MKWLTPTDDGCIITVKVVPRASRTEICASETDWLRVRLQAPPVDGKANALLTELFAKKFALAKRSVTILSGTTARLKRVKLSGITTHAAAKIIHSPKP